MPEEGRDYEEVVQEGIQREVDLRGMGDLNLVELEETGNKYRPGILTIQQEEKVLGIYYVDSYGQCFDEMTHKQLPKEGVIKARVEEMVQVYKHKLYTKVPIEECLQEIGKKPIQVRWIDINKGDEDNPDYRSRLVAKEIKTDNRLDLFAATPPLEAKKLVFSQAVTESIGFQKGDKDENRFH